jgi:hypothetical protein
MPEPCHYCGQYANTIDHVPPRTVWERMVGLGLWRHRKQLKLPCCRECNSALGPRRPLSLPGRQRWIRQWLARRYHRVLAMPDWDEPSIRQLGKSLRSYIRKQMTLKIHTVARIHWSDAIDLEERKAGHHIASREEL